MVLQYFMLSQSAEGAGSTLHTIVGEINSIPIEQTLGCPLL